MNFVVNTFANGKPLHSPVGFSFWDAQATTDLRSAVNLSQIAKRAEGANSTQEVDDGGLRMRASSTPQRNCPSCFTQLFPQCCPPPLSTTHASCAGSGWSVLPSLTARANGVSLATYFPLNSRRRRAWLEGLCSTRGGTLREARERVVPPIKPRRNSQALSDTSGSRTYGNGC